PSSPSSSAGWPADVFSPTEREGRHHLRLNRVNVRTPPEPDPGKEVSTGWSLSGWRTFPVDFGKSERCGGGPWVVSGAASGGRRSAWWSPAPPSTPPV